MSAQRRLLRAVNKADCWIEKLAGISFDAIERFARVNFMPSSDEIIQHLTAASRQLQFLATKSQEQLTEKYAKLGLEVEDLQRKIETAMANKMLDRSGGSAAS